MMKTAWIPLALSLWVVYTMGTPTFHGYIAENGAISRHSRTTEDHKAPTAKKTWVYKGRGGNVAAPCGACEDNVQKSSELTTPKHVQGKQYGLCLMPGRVGTMTTDMCEYEYDEDKWLFRKDMKSPGAMYHNYYGKCYCLFNSSSSCFDEGCQWNYLKEKDYYMFQNLKTMNCLNKGPFSELDFKPCNKNDILQAFQLH